MNANLVFYVYKDIEKDILEYFKQYKWYKDVEIQIEDNSYNKRISFVNLKNYETIFTLAIKRDGILSKIFYIYNYKKGEPICSKVYRYKFLNYFSFYKHDFPIKTIDEMNLLMEYIVSFAERYHICIKFK